MTQYFGLAIPFSAYCGIRPLEHGPGWTRTEVDILPEMHNSKGTGHGGLIATLLDTSMGSAVRTSDPSASGVITVDLHTTFIGPAVGTIRCEARIIERAGNTVFCEASVQTREGKPVARALGTFRLRH